MSKPSNSPSAETGSPLVSARRAVNERRWSDAQSLAIDQLAEDPECVDAYLVVAFCFLQASQFSAAESQVRQALHLDPNNSPAHKLAGDIAIKRQRFSDAVTHFKAAQSEGDDDTDMSLLQNLGNAASQIGDTETAETAFETILRHDPGHGAALLGLANVRQTKGHIDSAADLYRRCLKAMPNAKEPAANLGVLLQHQGKFSEARAYFDQAIATDANFAEARKNKAMLDLLTGNFEDGFDAYRWRWRQTRNFNAYRDFDAPKWDGSPLAGQSILVWAEQGVGDEIMFASLVPDIMTKASHTLIECEKRLVPLFQRSFEDATVFGREDPSAPPETFDVHAPLGDACVYLRSNQGAFACPKAYLIPDSEQVAAISERYSTTSPGPRIGIAWNSRTPMWGRIKSADLSHWGPVFDLPGCTFISLQYGDISNEIAAAQAMFGAQIFQDDLIDQMQDLDAFASQVAAMDLVVTTSNTTAHMAGALGVPTIIAVPFVPDWRWQHAGEQTLWYEHAILARQPAQGDWAGAFVAAAKKAAQILEL